MKLYQLLKPLVATEIQALVEKIDSLDADHTDHVIAGFINTRPLTKLERLVCVLAYQEYESRVNRFKAMEIVCPAPVKEYTSDAYVYSSPNLSGANRLNLNAAGSIDATQNLVFTQAGGTQQFELVGQPKKVKVIRSKVSL